MENLGKKVGFLKGLMEGMNLEANGANGKLMAGIVDLLGDLSDRVEAIDELLDDLNGYVESIDEDLSELEGAGDGLDDYMDDDAVDFDDDDDDDLFPTGEDKLHLLRPAQSETPEEEDSLAGNLCPECHAMFVTSLSDPDGSEYICPNCKKQVKPVPLSPENAVIAKPVEKE